MRPQWPKPRARFSQRPARRLGAPSAVRAIGAAGLAAALVLVACVSSEEDLIAMSEAPLLGMVYDYDNQPCAGAAILVDGVEAEQADINGRYVVRSLTKGSHKIGVRKAGYEELATSFEFLSKDQVLYLRVASLEQLLFRAEQALDAEQWDEADAWLRRAQAVRSDSLVLLYLESLLELHTGDPDSAAALLVSAVEKGYRQPVVYLTLADLYESYLDRPAEAIRYLEEYLRLSKSPEARERLQRLKERVLEDQAARNQALGSQASKP